MLFTFKLIMVVYKIKFRKRYYFLKQFLFQLIYIYNIIIIIIIIIEFLIYGYSSMKF